VTLGLWFIGSPGVYVDAWFTLRRKRSTKDLGETLQQGRATLTRAPHCPGLCYNWFRNCFRLQSAAKRVDLAAQPVAKPVVRVSVEVTGH
jgi:hypothetical protein